MTIASTSILHPRAILLNLSKDPRVRRRRAPNHDCIAAGLRDHGACVLGRANVAVANHRDLHSIFYRGNPLPAGLAVFASARVQCDCRQPAGFRHASQLHADDLVVIPSGAKLHREGNLHRGTHRFEDATDCRKIAQ